MNWKQELRKMALEITEIGTELARVRRTETALNAKIDLMTKTGQDQVLRMADRLVEAMMVNKGLAQAASVHRNAARVERPTDMPDKTDDLWAEQQDDWPPPGSDVINLP